MSFAKVPTPVYQYMLKQILYHWYWRYFNTYHTSLNIIHFTSVIVITTLGSVYLIYRFLAGEGMLL